MSYKIVPFIHGRAAYTLLWAVLLIISSCKNEDEEPVPVVPVNPKDIYVNGWIYEKMKFWYLWNHSIPDSPDKNTTPDVFFQSLLSTEDRFSWIQTNYKELLNSLVGISREAGYEFVVYRDKENPNNVLAQVTYVKPASPAAAAGLKRGDVITHINEQLLTISNYRDRFKDINKNYSIRYKPILVEEGTFGSEKTISLSPIEYAENPNYLHKIFEIDGGKIGYYVYNFFASGTEADNDLYDDEMDQIFANFKAQGITDLILDLRFNSGGSESSATNLASLIGANVNGAKIFFKREYNDQVKEAILNDPQGGEAYLKRNFISKNEQIGNQLNDNRVYILTGSRTASASELVINGLKPYMDVFLIGDTTVGKNVGSFSIYEENDPDNTWGIQPIVVKVLNSLDQSNYTFGFNPDIIIEDKTLFIYPLGDIRETLLKRALEHITGNPIPARVKDLQEQEVVAHSLDNKARSNRLVMENTIPESLLK